MLLNSSDNVSSQTNVKFSLAVLDYINAIRHRDRDKILVAGAGFEPATFRL